jgi:trigger factor
MVRAGPALFTEIVFDPEKGLTFTVEFDLLPAIDLPDFRSFTPESEELDDSALKDELSEYLLGSTSFDLPESLVQEEMKLSAEQGQNLDEEGLRADAEQRVKLLLILQAIAQAEGIEVDERDVDDRIAAIAEASGSSRQALHTELEQNSGLERLRLFLLAEQTMDYILEGTGL